MPRFTHGTALHVPSSSRSAARTSPRFERVEQLVDDALGVGGKRVAAPASPRSSSMRVARSPIEFTASAPAASAPSAPRRRACRFIGTSGRRSTFCVRPIIASAALAGIGFDSMNAARIHGSS